MWSSWQLVMDGQWRPKFGLQLLKNLHDMLVLAQVKLPRAPKDNPDAPLNECKFARCRYCPKLVLSDSNTCSMDPWTVDLTEPGNWCLANLRI